MSGFISNLFSNATQQPQNHVPVEQGDVMLTVDGKTVKTWGALRITRSLRKFSDYEVSLAEVWPNDPTKISLKPQQQVQIKIGKDKVLTGYVERYNASGSPGEHDIQIQGRSRCCDLQDCNIETSVQSSNIDILDFAKKLCAPFGKPPPINVSIVGNANPTRYPYINIDLTQTPKELICLVAAYSQMIVYDDVNGDLVLATVGAGTMGSGVQQGVNVDHWGVSITSDRRFSVYVAVVHSVGETLQNLDISNRFGQAVDPGVDRYRPKIFQGTIPVNGVNYAVQKAQWQCNYNIGQSQELTVVVNSWRDSKGKLWEPNYYCSIDMPDAKITSTPDDMWVIADVTYVRATNGGTTAELTLMRKVAFLPEPVAPFKGPVTQLPSANPTTTPTTPAKQNTFPTGPEGGPTSVNTTPGGSPT